MGSSFRIPIDTGILPDLRSLRLQLQCPKSNSIIPGQDVFWLLNSANNPTQIEDLRIIVYSITSLPQSRAFFRNDADDSPFWDVLHSENLRKKHSCLQKIFLNFNLEIMNAESNDQYGTFSISDLSHNLASDLRVLLAPADAISTRIDISASLDVVFESQRLHRVVF